MPIAVISDLHLAQGGPADPFGHRDADFLRFLDFLERNFRRIVLLGDIYETLHGPAPGQARLRLRQAREAHPELARRFAGSRYIYLHGNHDLVARDVDGAPSELLMRRGRTRVLFTHGHLHDWLIRRARWVSELGAWTGGRLMRLGLGGLVRRIEGLEGRLRQPSQDPLRCRFNRWAFGLAKTRQADVVVTGHTHRSGCTQREGLIHLNSGACRGGAYSFAVVDPAAQRYSVHDSW